MVLYSFHLTHIISFGVVFFRMVFDGQVAAIANASRCFAKESVHIDVEHANMEETCAFVFRVLSFIETDASDFAQGDQEYPCKCLTELQDLSVASLAHIRMCVCQTHA